tara:strand:- start:76416 stop:76850 length:435 start_codon:yes stop_codon:yes gene_type:complete
MKNNSIAFYTDISKKENLKILQEASSVYQNTFLFFDTAVEKSSDLRIPMINSSCMWGYKGTLIVTDHIDLFEVLNIASDIKVFYAIDNDKNYKGNLLHILSNCEKFNLVAKEENKNQYQRLFGKNIVINTYELFNQFIQELSNE